MMLAPYSLPVLAYMRKERGFLFFEYERDVHIGVGQKPTGLAAAVDFKEVKMRWLPQSHTGTNGEKTGHLMIHVGVNRPVGKDEVGILSGEHFCHRLHLRAGDLGGAVDLAEKDWFSTDDLAGSFALRRANGCGFIELFIANASLAAREVDHGHRFAQLSVTNQGPGAT